METKLKQKAKQVIKELDFSSDGCAVSLVGPSVGGAANNFKTLIFKSTLNKESKPTGDDTSKTEVTEGIIPVDKSKIKETNMDEIVELQKSLTDNQTMLQKALDQIKAFEEDKKQSVIKSKTAKVKEIIKDAKHAEIITKACLELESEEDFSAFIAAISAMMQTVATSDMFVEKGLRVDNTEVTPEVSHVEKMLKAKYAAK